MVTLETKYMGLKLKSPIIIGSCGLTNSIDNIKNFEKYGAGAIVLKSIFEEQIRYEVMNSLKSHSNDPFYNEYNNISLKKDYEYAESLQYVSNYTKENTLKEYVNLIKEAKKSVSIPIIASINCTTPYDWYYFTKRIQEAGADAIELNIYMLPSDKTKNSEFYEKTHFDIISNVLKEVSIPVSVKVSYYFTSLAYTLSKIANTGIKALVLFNRPFSPDIDINTFNITSSNILSSSSDYSQTLRWVALLSCNISCDIAATTGIYNHETAIKQILAGASAVQIVSAIYKNSPNIISEINNNIMKWMENNKFNSINDFKGKLSSKNVKNPADFERVQFMKYYSNIE